MEKDKNETQGAESEEFENVVKYKEEEDEEKRGPRGSLGPRKSKQEPRGTLSSKGCRGEELRGLLSSEI